MMHDTYLTIRDETVTKSNDLIQQSRFCLSAQQQKCILYIISQVNPSDDNFKYYDFSIQEFCRICGIDADGRTYKSLKDALLGIRNAGIWVTRPDGTEVTLAWLDKVMINSKDGIVRVRLDEDMIPYLLHLKGNFTTYEIIYTLHFKSKYTIRLYELIKSVHYHELETYQRMFSVEDLKIRMDAEKYTEYKNFKSRALEPAVREINEYSDKNITYIECKKRTGRKISDIIFTIETKSAMERIKIRDQIDKDMGLLPGQMTLWDEMHRSEIGLVEE